MSHNPKEAEKEMEKTIFISADCWLEVFVLLPRSQLGFGIAMISHRFDYFVDEHFKTRKWKLDKLEIRSKIGINGARKMEIVNSNGKALPIPQNPLPKKIIGFGSISINFFDQNVLTFLRRFHRFFTKCETKIHITTENVRISEFVVFTIWPMFKDTIHVMIFNPITFRQIRQFAPSMLNFCPSLRVVAFDDGILPEFPPDDSANASDGQAVTKWLFTPNPDNLPKMLSIENLAVNQWSTIEQQTKAAFSAASSPVSFGISVGFLSSASLSSVVPFELTNELTKEKLTLSQEYVNVFKLIRCSIAAGDKGKWMKEMNELVRGQKNNKIGIFIGDDGIDNK